MERTSRLFLGLEAPSASLLLRFWAIITINKGFLNTNTKAATIRTARMLEEELVASWLAETKMSQALGVSVSVSVSVSVYVLCCWISQC
jgi:hypothetical protein